MRIREKIGSQAKAPAPLIRKSLCVNVGQALSPANPALVPILSRILRIRVVRSLARIVAPRVSKGTGADNRTATVRCRCLYCAAAFAVNFSSAS